MKLLGLAAAGLALVCLSSGCRGIQIGEIETTSAKVPATKDAQKAPKQEPVAENKVADLERDVATALQSQDAAATIEKLGAIRLEILKRRQVGVDAWVPKPLTKPEEIYGPAWTKEKAPEILGKEGFTLLRRTHHERARLYFELGKNLEALRELMSSAVFTACRKEESTCSAVRQKLAAQYPDVCPSHLAETDECIVGQEQFLMATGKEKAVGQVTVESAKRVSPKSNDWIVVGKEYSPEGYQTCEGQFETDKIKDVTQTQIIIERTTWCRAIKQGSHPGAKATYRISNPPFDLTNASYLTILVDRARVKSSQKGNMILATIHQPTVLNVWSDKESFRGNQVLPNAMTRELSYR